MPRIGGATARRFTAAACGNSARGGSDFCTENQPLLAGDLVARVIVRAEDSVVEVAAVIEADCGGMCGGSDGGGELKNRPRQ